MVETPDELSRLPAAVEVAVYRIVQEALTNVARHAQARKCSVTLLIDEAAKVLWLEVRDDGRGMPENRESGVGLASMRERAAELGGSLAVDSLPDGGVAVRAQLPLPEEE
jgi:signal transduction histidine kinase